MAFNLRSAKPLTTALLVMFPVLSAGAEDDPRFEQYRKELVSCMNYALDEMIAAHGAEGMGSNGAS